MLLASHEVENEKHEHLRWLCGICITPLPSTDIFAEYLNPAPGAGHYLRPEQLTRMPLSHPDEAFSP